AAGAKSATANAAGTISGDATGSVDHTAGIVEFTATDLPDVGEQFHYAYDWTSGAHMETFTPTVASHQAGVTLAHPPAENSIVASWTIYAPAANGGQGYSRNYVVTDDGAGGFNGALSGTNTVNYGTGEINLRVD